MAGKHQVWSSNKGTRDRAQRSWRRSYNEGLRQPRSARANPHHRAARKPAPGRFHVRAAPFPNPVLPGDFETL